MPVMKPCADPDCGELVPKGTDRCKLHRRDNRARRKREGLTGKRGSTARWRRIRARVLRRDHNRCQRCGNERELEVHHKDGNPTNNAMWNLVTLCGYCHRLAEAAKKAAIERREQQA
jgi:5-methylcytosine-specific restriction endonuclease McrA